MNTDAPRPPVLLLHGLWMNRLVMLWLARALEREGFAPHCVGYRSMRGELGDHVDAVRRQIAALPGYAVHLVGHSLGGLVALACLDGAAGPRLGRTVLLGTPIAGSRAARRFAGYPGGRLLLGRSATVWEAPPAPPRGSDVGVIAGLRPFGMTRILMPLPGSNDGVVTVEETRQPWLADHLELPVSHSGMLVSAQVARQTAAFLRRGRFDR